jgi:hypothetical protein
VTSDRPCRRCGGNLNGQHLGGRCAGCGEPVGASVYGDLLAYADPAWLRAVGNGLRTVWWTILVVAGLIAVLAIIFSVVGIREASRQIASGAATRPATQGASELELSPGGIGWQVGGGLVYLAVLFTVIRGVWLATTADPRRPTPDLDAPLQKRTRTLFAATGGKAVIDLIVALVVTSVTGNASLTERQAVAAHPLMLASDLVTGALFVTALVSLAYHLSRLAGRVPDLRLAARARAAGWGLASCGAAAVAFNLLILTLTGRENPWAPGPGGAAPSPSLMAGGCAASLIGLTALGFAVFYWIGIGQTARRVQAAREYAAAVWAQPFGPTGAAAGASPPSTANGPP